MSQFDFGNLESPLSGTSLINANLEPWRDALHSQHSGASRPSYAVAGTLWLDNTTTPWLLKMYDGADDITIGIVNATTNRFDVKAFGADLPTDTGAANAYAIAPAPVITAYAAGQIFLLKPANTSTANASTMNVNALGTKNIKTIDGADPAIGMISSSAVHMFVYDGTNMILLNPAPASRQSLAIASGVLSVPAGCTSVRIGTEGAAATDTVNTINVVGGNVEGMEIDFRGVSNSQDVTFESGTGNIVLKGNFDFAPSAASYQFVLRFDGSNWLEKSRSTNIAGEADFQGTFSKAYEAVSATISGNAITITSTAALIVLTVDTEGAAATDVLDNINGGIAGQRMLIRSANSSRDTTITDSATLLTSISAGNFTLAGTAHRFEMLCASPGIWVEVGRCDA